MFALFFSLYRAMLLGSWQNFSITDINNTIKGAFNKIGEFLTSLLNNVDTPITDFGDVMLANSYATPNWCGIVSFALALITSIGIVVMAAKGVKKAFGIFFMGIR